MLRAPIPSRLLGGPSLSPREVDLIACLASGLSTKEAARRLGISYHTAIHHLRIAMTRLGAHNRVELLAQAAAHGFLPPPRLRLTRASRRSGASFSNR